MTMIKYHFAKNEIGELVDIDDVSVEYRSAHSFFCLGCGKEMQARLGAKNAHHFFHLDGNDCGNGETDLHRYAKKMLRKKFLTEERFPIRFVQDISCGAQCPFFNAMMCHDNRLEEFDLKAFGYDTIEEEKVVSGGYIADLLISDSSGKNPAILLEIFVKHKVGERKENSGLRIIEIPIRNEDDLETYLRGPISECDPDEYHARVLSRSPHFYGFRRTAKITESLGVRALPVASMQIDYSITCTEIEENVPCDEIDTLYCLPDDLLRVVFNPDTMYSYRKRLGSFVRMVAVKEGISVKNCKICEHRFCKMSSQLHWPVLECSHFALNETRVRYLEEKEFSKDSYKVIKNWPDGKVANDDFWAAWRFVAKEGFVDSYGKVNVRWCANIYKRVIFVSWVFELGQEDVSRFVVVENRQVRWASTSDMSLIREKGFITCDQTC